MKHDRISVERLKPAYTPAGFFLLRAPTLSANVFTSLGRTNFLAAGKNHPDDALTASYEQVKQLVACPEIERALLVASASITQGIKSLHQENTPQRRIAHVYSRLLRYLVRMSTRPTPFGLFAGVTSGLFAEQTTVQLAEPALKRIRTRPDMAWLLAIIEYIEHDPQLWKWLQVQVNHTAYFSDDRVIVSGADVYGKGDHHLINLRATAPVRYVLEHARHPIAYPQLRADLARAFSSVAEAQIDRLLEQLWTHHVLISNLRPPLTSANPICYVIEQMRQIPEAVEIVAHLQEVLALTTLVDQADRNHYCTSIHRLLAVQQELLPQNRFQPFQVDTALRLVGSVLNKKVGEAAALAAETLLSCGRAPQGMPHLHDYHQTFIKRYGVGAEVPLLELLQTDKGLDVPYGYKHPEPEIRRASPPNADRRKLDEFLSTLAANAINQHDMEIILTDTTVEKLVQLSPQANTVLPPSLAVLFQIQAESREAIDRGDWRAVLSPNVLSPGGSIAGRFFDLLGDEGLQHLQELVRREEAIAPDAIFAELSYLPPFGRKNNVAIRPMLRAYEIVVNTAPTLPPERVIALQDLVVGATAERLYLRSLRLGKEVIVCQNHVLNYTSGPNIYRFLLEVSCMRYALLTQFDWGTASYLPFLPRVVRKNVVLSPAQWNLYRATIMPTGTGSEEARWFAAIAQWRERWRVPRFVYLTYLDNRLLLDLEHPAFVAELVAELKKLDETGCVCLQEMLPDFSQLWLRNTREEPYLSEIVVPLLSTQQAVQHNGFETQAEQVRLHTGQERVLRLVERCEAPGSLWTYLKLYVSTQRQDELISGPLRKFVQHLREQSLYDRWFYIRYYDPESHLRIRFHASDQERSKDVLAQAVAWGQQLTQCGLIGRFCVDTYEREIERYGGLQAIDYLEQAFSVDSEVVSSLIAAAYQRQLTLDLPLVAVMSLDALVAAWGLTPEQRVQHSQLLTQKYRFAEEFRKQRTLLCDLLTPGAAGCDPSVQPQREYMRAVFTQYHTLQPVVQAVSTLDEQGSLKQPLASILRSLAHMHVNRLLGINREQESQVYAFWHNTLKSIMLRPAVGGVARTGVKS